MTKPGTRVMALRGSDPKEKKAWVFGKGVYEGKFPRPGTTETPPTAEADMIRSIIVKSDAEESLQEKRDWMRSMLAGQVAQDKMTQEEAEEKLQHFLDHQQETLKKPLEERIQAVWDSMRENPRIKLDGGGYCWGFECWWGPEEQVAKRLEGYELIPVKPEFGDAG